MMIPPFLMSRTVVYIAIAATAGAAGWTINGWRLNNAMTKLKADYAQAETKAHKQALEDLVSASLAIKQAADEYTSVEMKTSRKIDLLRKEVGQYAKEKPLPADCRPDVVRVRKLSDSIDAANEAITR
jgi:hypothetical protein